MAKIKYRWHKYWYKHNKVLLEECLDQKIQYKLKRKVLYHERKALQQMLIL